MTSELLQCPDCGEQSFGWTVKQVQFGNVHQFDDGSRDVEAVRSGNIVDDDLDQGVYCRTCDEEKQLDELVVGEDEQ